MTLLSAPPTPHETTTPAHGQETAVDQEDSTFLYTLLCANPTIPQQPTPIHTGRQCIIYLEPRQGTWLNLAINEFLTQSDARWGPTEAHMYHPHSSMTGFIQLPDQAAGQALTDLTFQLRKAVIHCRATITVPQVMGTRIVRDYPHGGTHKVDLVLETPPVFAQLVEMVRENTRGQLLVRTKKMQHISLAYFNKHVKTARVLTEYRAGLLMKLANALLTATDSSDDNLWDIALYDLAYKSHSIHTPHQLNLVARWHL